MNEFTKGLFRRYSVERIDGSSKPGAKHERCSYYVLDLEHDEFAAPALEAYANACRDSHPNLAVDLERVVKAIRSRKTSVAQLVTYCSCGAHLLDAECCCTRRGDE